MSDDLNTPTCLTFVEEIAQLKRGSAADKLGALMQLDGILGLNLLGLTRFDLRIRPKTATITEDAIEALLARRKEVRAAKDFAASDHLRAELIAAGRAENGGASGRGKGG